MNDERIKKLVRELIIELGEDPTREGLKRTPERIANMYKEIFGGYDSDSELSVQFYEDSDVVIARDIQFYSMCEHHMLPFFGKVHVAYLPKGKIVGLSKMPRIVDIFARRLQVQEKMTMQIAECINEMLKPLGVAVVVEAFHLCMAMRGVEKQSCRCITSTMLGAFRTNQKTRMEFMNMVTSSHTSLTH